MTNEAIITGMTVINPGEKAMNEMRHGIFAFLDTGVLKPVIGHEFSLEEASIAHKSLMETSGSGRTIFKIREES